MAAGKPWYTALLRMVNSSLKAASKTAKKVLLLVRVLWTFLFIGVLSVIAAQVIGIWRPEYIPYTNAVAAFFLLIPLLVLFVLVTLPLRAKSITRLIDLGYPENVRELGIRVVARKLHDESIETEELLVETAWNESKKALRKYRQRAQRLKEELDKPMSSDDDADADEPSEKPTSE